MFIEIRKTFTNVDTHIGIRKTRNWFRYETFYYLIEFKVFRHEERETQFLFMLTFRSNPHHVRYLRHNLQVWPWRAPKIVYLPLSSNLNSTAFFPNLKILSPASEHDVIYVPGHNFLFGVFIVTSLIVTPAPHSAWAPALNVCT